VYNNASNLSITSRVFQYFLNYTKKHFGGQSWIDKHIHTFYAVGAPFLGAPKILRGLVWNYYPIVFGSSHKCAEILLRFYFKEIMEEVYKSP
jgi:hypothetical protein